MLFALIGQSNLAAFIQDETTSKKNVSQLRNDDNEYYVHRK